MLTNYSIHSMDDAMQEVAQEWATEVLDASDYRTLEPYILKAVEPIAMQLIEETFQGAYNELLAIEEALEADLEELQEKMLALVIENIEKEFHQLK